MRVSINPTYFCNFRCSWCYLTPFQLSNNKKLNLLKLDNLLSNINKISHVDLYGGEIGLLPETYVDDLLNVIKKHYQKNISITTNLSSIPKWFNREDIDIAVSYEFGHREQHDRVLKNMLILSKPIHLIILAHSKIINDNVDEMIRILNKVSNIKSVEIKPYSINQANQDYVSNLNFENFVKFWITSSEKKKFLFQNLKNLENSLKKNYNAFSDDHIYITPNDRYAVLEFDQNDKEYFLEFDSLDFYFQWTIEEKNKIYSNKFCSKCKFVGNCLTEHYRDVKTIDNGCNGYYNLISWYQNYILK